jgi:glycosyltransferase involved in cell wall biosynthesis
VKLLLASQFYPPVVGGEERHVRNLARELTRRGHEVHVATQALGEVPREYDDDGVAVHELRSLSSRLTWLHSDTTRPHALPTPDPALARHFAELADRIEPDVVHAHNWIVNSLLSSKTRRGAPLVLTLHDYSQGCATHRMMRSGEVCAGPGLRACIGCASAHYGVGKGVVTALSTLAMRGPKARSVDAFVCVSSAVASGNAVLDGDVPTFVLPNFIPDDLLRTVPVVARPSFLPAGDFAVFVGELSREKGLHTLLRAREMQQTPRLPLVVIGRHTSDTPDAWPDDVTVLGSVAHDSVVAAFQHALFAVLPSEWMDPCPTTVLEAMALGTPVVTTRIGGMVDILDGTDAGLLVAPADAAALRDALDTVGSDSDRRATMAQAARRRVRDFTVGVVAEGLEKVYVQVLSNRSQDTPADRAGAEPSGPARDG